MDLREEKSEGMLYNISWDANIYRSSHESDEQWCLKNKFFELNKGKYPEEQLACYAQVLSNMEFLGCRYSNETVRIVKQLSGDLFDTYHYQQAKHLKRTFVRASEAAHSKFSGKRFRADPVQSIPSGRLTFVRGISCEFTEGKKTDQANGKNISPTIIDNDSYSTCNDLPVHLKSNLYIFVNPGNANNPFGILEQSSHMSEMQLTCEVKPTDTSFNCSIIIGDHLVMERTGKSMKEAKRACAEAALELLERHCVVIKVKASIHSDGTIERNEMGIQPAHKILPNANQTIEMSLGMRLLQSMGWKGGGLGKNGTGISEPISASQINGRQGIGHIEGVSKTFKQNFNDLIRAYLATDLSTDLKFSTDFTPEERKYMHLAARRFNLKSASRGKGDNRFLVVFKRFNAQELIHHLQSLGGSSEKYEIIYPNP